MKYAIIFAALLALSACKLDLRTMPGGGNNTDNTEQSGDGTPSE